MRISDRKKKKKNPADTIYPKQGDPEESQWSNQAAKMGLCWNSPIPVISSRQVLSTINLHSRQRFQLCFSLKAPQSLNLIKISVR